MSDALHLLNLDAVWRAEGPLQASLAKVLGPRRIEPEPPKRRIGGKLRAKVEAMVDKGIALLDELDGDADFEPEPDEADGDVEPNLGWPAPGVQAFAAGEDRED